MAPTISSTCVECGMEKGHSLLYCPTCTLVKNQQKQFEQLQNKTVRTSPVAHSSEDTQSIIGGVFGIILFFATCTWMISDMSFWESFGAVVMAPFHFFKFIFLIIIGLVA